MRHQADPKWSEDRILVEDKQDVSRGTLPSAMASITMVREPLFQQKEGELNDVWRAIDISLSPFTKLLGN